ncbi:MAG: 4Fe-4S binding protein [Bacteroidales bacterium]|jgi:2-oxoglutarate ferredoxin oxidoreductase subunit delta|nr:4Fe-4S binding protein [Bacteroidales bacterium]
MAKIVGDIVIDVEKCKGCGVCVTGCPQDVLILGKEVNAKGYNFVVKQNNKCIGCANCAMICPDAVITVYRAKIEE